MEDSNKANKSSSTIEKSSSCLFQNLKSTIILKKILNNMQKWKSLEMIKYNNKTKERLNINVNVYKEYSEKYSSIELEIIPTDSYFGGKYISFDEKDESYYHIYLNNSKEEIKRKNLRKSENISKINIIIDYQILSFEFLFYCCDDIKSITFTKFYRNNVTNMKSMFNRCYNLKEINFAKFNTDNVINMCCMFYKCSSLNEINLSNFNTHNVTDMRCMFSGCSSLQEIKLPNFNTNKVQDMTGMFEGCSSLEELNLSNFNTINVVNMNSMFEGCSYLKDINLSSFNFNNEQYMYGMFAGCSNSLKNKIKSEFKKIKEEAFN